jgi:Mg-chelatase subunit ChlD
MIQLIPEEILNNEGVSNDVVCVIDDSGSMEDQAAVKNDAG